MTSPRDYFEQLAWRRYKGVLGVHRIDALEGGPVLGIGIATHGNEIEGLAAFASLPKLVRGSVVLVLCNLEAVTRHFCAEESVRYIDTNMNRLPSSLNSSASEVVRARELLPVLESFDYGMDIHSTPGPSEPMSLNVRGEGLSLVPTIPIQIDGMLEHQAGVPLSSLFGGKSVVGVEAGQQGTEQAWEDAQRIFETTLAVLGMADEEPPPSVEKSHYQILQPIYFPNPTYRFFPRLLTGTFSSLREGTYPKVKKGAPIAYGEGTTLRAPDDGVLLFPRRKVSDLTDEAAFLARFNS